MHAFIIKQFAYYIKTSLKGKFGICVYSINYAISNIIIKI